MSDKGEAARKTVLLAIRYMPSANLARLSRMTGLGRTTVKYHLDVLQARGEVFRGECHNCGSKAWGVRGDG